MHIAYTFYDWPGYCAGPRINALRLLPELKRRGYDVTAIVLFRGTLASDEFLVSNGIKVIAKEYEPLVQARTRFVLDALEDAQPDLYVPNISVAGCYAGRYFRDSGRPTIVGHLSDDDFNWGMAERFCKFQDEWAVSGMFCMGRELGDIVRGWRPDRTHVVDICHGVEVPALTADPLGPLRFVFAGRMEDNQKRVMDLAKALRAVLQHRSDAEVKFIGDGSKRQDVETLFKKAGLGGRVHFTGFVEPDSVQDEMRWGNVFVLLSDYEGVPGAVMDSMAVGLVPLCLNIEGGLRELVVDGETGILVNDRNESFMAAVQRLADDIEFRKRLSHNAIKHIKAGFSLAESADRWERLFRKLWTDRGEFKDRFVAPKTFVLPDAYEKLGPEDKRIVVGGGRQRWLSKFASMIGVR
ncbi:Alpha-D-kanosaminyltransferase [Roseimaritima multifibrata]|uniref:Alpha-D-kanosaminyltransferase n=2 Tax=Roseimaritima multifibrata TaxID=1930274 RepID=A0A517MN96_9BACT|nr:Alpha-D-kanosaminyltransferase [Roseimaritima multifibrata]